MKTKLLCLALASLFASACAADAPQPPESDQVVLFDPCTGAEIGVEDRSTGQLSFYNGDMFHSMSVTSDELPADLCNLESVYSRRVCFIAADPDCRGCCDGLTCFLSCDP